MPLDAAPNAPSTQSNAEKHKDFSSDVPSSGVFFMRHQMQNFFEIMVVFVFGLFLTKENLLPAFLPKLVGELFLILSREIWREICGIFRTHIKITGQNKKSGAFFREKICASKKDSCQLRSANVPP